ncbi:MAG: hypothetical protein ACK521_01075 [bacterium]|jgi:hypothetical protein
MKDFKPLNSKLHVNMDIIDAYNAGICGEELKGLYTNKNKKSGDADLPLTLIKATRLRLENFGYKVLVNHQMSSG